MRPLQNRRLIMNIERVSNNYAIERAKDYKYLFIMSDDLDPDRRNLACRLVYYSPRKMHPLKMTSNKLAVLCLKRWEVRIIGGLVGLELNFKFYNPYMRHRLEMA